MAGAIELFPQRAGCIFRLVHTPALEFRHDQIGDVDEGFRCHRIGEVETVDTGFRDPVLRTSSATSWYDPTMTGPRPPIAAWRAISLTVQVRSGSAVVKDFQRRDHGVRGR